VSVGDAALDLALISRMPTYILIYYRVSWKLPDISFSIVTMIKRLDRSLSLDRSFGLDRNLSLERSLSLDRNLSLDRSLKMDRNWSLDCLNNKNLVAQLNKDFQHIF